MIISNRTLDQLKSKGMIVPSYERKSMQASYVHVGLGHFHRSHFLTYMDRLLNDGHEENGVFEVDIMPSNLNFIEGLKKQDYLYSVLALSADGSRELRINGPIVGYANQTQDPGKVHEVLTSPYTRLITLTITEKGYCYLEGKGSIDWDNPLVINDLKSGNTPKSAIGCLAKALKTRFELHAPVTIMSCDNIPENGKILKRCLLQFCEKKYPEIASWVAAEIAFPCTMVDRITPGTSPDDIESLKSDYDLEDSCPVHCEDFTQWIIEDSTCTTIPDFAKVGALIVNDVKPYELMKIRLLNGSHSALSYPAHLMGIEMVHDAMIDPTIRSFIRKYYMEHISGTLPKIFGVDLETYKDQLISRFSNHHIADKVLRLASDGSKKIANAILRPLEEGLESGKNVDSLILALAIWQYYYLFRDANNEPMPIDDPNKKKLIAASNDSRCFLVEAGLDTHAFAHEELSIKMERFLNLLKTNGVRKTLEDLTK